MLTINVVRDFNCDSK